MIDVASPSHSPIVDDLIAKAFASLRHIYIPSGAPTPNAADSICLILIDRSWIVATLSYYIAPPDVRLYRVAVDPAHQRQGFASRLIDHVDETVAKPKGYTLALYTIQETGNVDIFRKLGFRVRSRCIAPYAQSPTGQSVHEVEMTRGPSN